MKLLIFYTGTLLIAWPWICFEVALGTGSSLREIGESRPNALRRALAVFVGWRWLVAYIGLMIVVLGLLI